MVEITSSKQKSKKDQNITRAAPSLKNSQQQTSMFIGETGPGAVINQYLPQPGQHIGRRIIKIEDTSDKYWLDSSSSLGTPWNEHLGFEKIDNEIWEISHPDRLVSTWFDERSHRQPEQLTPALQRTKVDVIASAQNSLANSGSLRNWSQGRVDGWPRGGTQHSGGTTAAYMRGGSGDEPRGPTTEDGTDILELEFPETPKDQEEQEDAVVGFQSSLTQIDEGIVKFPSSTWGGNITDVDVDLDAPPEPTLFIIQVIGISSFLGDFGLGKNVKTLTLLPGETSTISTRTWRATEESIASASSIIDSYDENSSERFAETVMSETTDTATRDKTENWHAEAEVKGSIGIVGGSVSGGGGGEYSSSTEEFSKAVDESVAEHAAEASSHRENSVTSSSESSVSTENEQVIERTIKNINVSRTLNFSFRELNQAYTTKTHLKDVRIAFSNGNVGTWREEPIAGMRKLIEEVIKPEFVDEICTDIIKTIAITHDVNGTPVRVLEQVQLDKCAVNFRVRDAEPNDNCDYPAPSADGRLYYRFKRGPLAQDQSEEHPVEGVLLKERQIMLGSDSVVAEALLGTENALDDYSEELQQQSIRAQKLSSDREELAQEIISSADDLRADIYTKIYGPHDEEEVTA